MNTNMPERLPTLEELRTEIDRIDILIHDLIMERTRIVDSVRRVKQNERVKIRPGREAEMLYRLSARHKGKFPKQILLRIWREMISGTLTIEGPFCVAIQTPNNITGYIDLARDHYGGYTNISTHVNARDIIDAVATDRAAIGVLPFPVQNADDDWWNNLPITDDDSIRVIARLPFFGTSSAPGAKPGGIPLDALVISYAEPVEADRDITLMSFNTNHDASTTDIIDAFEQLKLNIISVIASPPQRDRNCKALIEIEGFHNTVDFDLPDFIKKITWLGSYSTPIEDDELFANSMETQK